MSAALERHISRAGGWELGQRVEGVVGAGEGAVCRAVSGSCSGSGVSLQAGCAFLYVDDASIKHFKSVCSLTTLLCVVGTQGHSPTAHKINYVTAI